MLGSLAAHVSRALKSADNVEGVIGRIRDERDVSNLENRGLFEASMKLVDELNSIANVFKRVKWNLE